jgi:hypothetical protein
MTKLNLYANRFKIGIFPLLAGKLVFLLLVANFSSCKHNAPGIYTVTDYGAGTNKQLSTKSIQQAIDKCHEAGGGRVYFPPGDYLSGTIVLKDNVTLYLEAGATLIASNDTNDYKTDFKVFKKDDSGKKGAGETPVFIYAKEAKNIAIQGKGTIHGQARREYRDLEKVDGFIADITENAKKAGVEMKMYYKVKPYVCMVFLESCEFVHIRDASFIESCDWTLHFKWCDRVYIDNIYLESSLEAGVNADGIDIDGCHDVAITNSIITTGDDAIVLKTTMTYPDFRSCENVTVSNCILTSTSTALKLGTESYGDFKHITFQNCVIRNSNRGLSIVIRDGGVVDNVLFSDITIDCNRKHFNWWGNGDPIWLVLKKRRDNSKVGMIKNVSFDHILAHGQGTSKIEGFVGDDTDQAKALENIKLTNVRFTMHNENYLDKRATYVFSAHNVSNLTLSDIESHWEQDTIEPNWKGAFHFEDINRLRLDKLCGEQAPTGKDAFIRLDHVEDAIIERCKPFSGTHLFLQATHSQAVLSNNYLQYVQTRILNKNSTINNQ